MEADAISTPVSNTINRLAASLSDALNSSIVKWTLLAVQVGLGGDLVGPAALIFVTTCKQGPPSYVVQEVDKLLFVREHFKILDRVLQAWRHLVVVQNKRQLSIIQVLDQSSLS